MKPLFFTALVMVLFFGGYGELHGAGKDKSGLRPSDPQYDGPRDMNYDHNIVPGERIGPVQLGGSVRDALRHLGNPDSVGRLVCGGVRPCPPDTVYYWYTKNDCIYFGWVDTGLDPKITMVAATCEKWSTRDGLRVGSNMADLDGRIGEYCPMQFTSKDRRFTVFTKRGIDFTGKNRNSSILEISVSEARNSWNGLCRD
jgi:hypothetical protein